MFDLTADQETITNMIYGIIMFVIVNTMLCLYLLNKYLEEKRKNRLMKSTQKDSLTRLREYMDQQFAATKKYNATGSEHPLHKEVVALRTAYLRIEREALNNKIEGLMYWKTLNTNLYKLIKIIFPQLFSREAEVKVMEEKILLMKQRINKLPIDPNDEKARAYQERALSSLDQFATRFRSAGDAQKRIGGYVDRMKTVVELFEDPSKRRTFVDKKRQLNYMDRSNTELDTLQENTKKSSKSIDKINHTLDKAGNSDDLEKELHRFQIENQKLNKYVANLKQQIKHSRGHLERPDGDEHGHDTSKLDLHEVSDEILEANEREIDRLREVINQQRASIYSMEEALTVITPGTVDPGNNDQEHIEQSHVRNNEVEKLRQCIQESEVCIEMLEKELELLKWDLEQLRHPTDAPHVTGAETEQLSQELEQVKTELDETINRNNQQEQLLAFIEAALIATSIEDIALLIYESIISLNFTPSLAINLPGKTIGVAGQGGMATRDKVIINNMRIDEVNPNDKGELALRFLHIAGIVRPGEWRDDASDDHEYLVQLIKMADRIIHQIIQTQKSRTANRVIHECINTLKQTSYDLDKMLETHNHRTKNMVSNTIGQIQDIGRSKGLSASHIASFRAIEQETLKQLDADNSVRLKVRKKFLALVNEMESNNS